MPRALSLLWAVKLAGDLDEPQLLDSLDALDAGYGDAIAAESEDIGANVRAHRRLFTRLGFFARTVDDRLLALDLASATPEDPPVVALDSEGRYSWLGRNIADALFRIGDCSEQMKTWLARHGLRGEEPGDIGASTQFLPSLGDLHARYYAEEQGRAPKLRLVRSGPALRDDAIAWIGRPAHEVEAVLRELLALGLAPFQKQWVQCDAEGNVATVWLRKSDAPLNLRVRGVMLGATRSTVRGLFGAPQKGRASWDGFTIDGVAINVAFRDERADMITLMSRWPGE
jgi:hypothetical protein